MAGIIEASELVENKENTGLVLAKGEFDYDNTQHKYMLICINNGTDNEHYLTQYDYGSDLGFSKDININDNIELKILDEYTARWDVLLPR